MTALYRARVARGWSRYRAAGYAGVSPSTMVRWERGSDPYKQPWLFRRYSELLGVWHGPRQYYSAVVDEETRAEIVEDSRGRW